MRGTIIAMSVLVSAYALAAEPPAPASETRATNAAPASQSTASQKTAAKAPTAQSRSAKPAASDARPKADRLDLDTTVVTGNRELPKVLYIVPWKKADLGDLPAQPFNTLLDEVLTPVDRDVFRREVTYYGAIAADGQTVPAAPAAAATEAPGSEK
jgi:hypothetical protein